MDEPGRTLAVDLGDRYTGLAICDALGISIRQLAVLDCADVHQRARRILLCLAEEEAVRVLLGLPLNMDGSEGHQAHQTRAFGRLLEQLQPGLEIVFWDERLTSLEAREILGRAGRQRRE